MKENRAAKIIELLTRRQPDLTVFMDNVHKPHNLSAIVRSCDAVGIGEVHAVREEGLIKRYKGTSMGSDRWVQAHRYANFSDGIEVIRAKGMQVLAAHFSDRAVDFRTIDYTKPTCVLVGAEKFGVSEEAAAAAEHHVLIPMLGMVQSLNVSVATAVILYEAERQRSEAGMYAERKISDETFNRLKFEWLYPQIKRHCDKHKIRYPYVNDCGQIEDPEWDAIRNSL